MAQVTDWIAQTYTTNSAPMNASRCVNMFAEQEIQDAKSKAPVGIWMHPGTAPFSDTGKGPVINFTTMGGFVYAVTGSALFRIEHNGNATWLGHTSVSTNGCSIDNNGQTIIWVDGITGWSYSATHGVNQIIDENFFPCTTVTYYDTYFVFARKGTQYFFISQPQWNGVDALVGSDGVNPGNNFATKEATSDLIVAIVNSHEQLFIAGEKRIEVWYDAGNSAPEFPFQRSYGALIQRGLMAPYTMILEDNTIFFLGDDMIFYRLNGFVPERYSNHAIETQWASYRQPQLARAFSYTVFGHKMIAITFPTAKATWVLDLATKRWHERESWIGEDHDKSIGRWRVNCVLNNSSSTVRYPELLLGDSLTGRIDQLNNNVFTEFGHTMRALLIGPPLHTDRRRLFLKKFELDVESGVGIPAKGEDIPSTKRGYYALPRSPPNKVAANGQGNAVSADGNVVVGWVSPSVEPGLPPSDFDFDNTAVYWVSLDGPFYIFPYTSYFDPAYHTSTANGVSADGSVIVGVTLGRSPSTGLGGDLAFVWTLGTGAVVFGDLGWCNSVSGDGNVIVGGQQDGDFNHEQAVWWDRATLTRHNLGYLPGHNHSLCCACSYDGSVIVGWSTFGTFANASNPGTKAFRWTAATGMVDLGFIASPDFPGLEAFLATGVSYDGSVVTGSQFSNINPGFRWTAATGMVSIPVGASGSTQSVSGDGTTAITAPGTVAGYYKDGTLTLQPTVPLDVQTPGVLQITENMGVNYDGTVLAGCADPSFVGVIPPGVDSTMIHRVPYVFYVAPPPVLTPSILEAHDPQWRLTVSDDGGRTWSRLVKPRSIGATGHYLTRLRWLKMGQARERMIRLECTDPIRRNIIGIYIDAGQGMT